MENEKLLKHQIFDICTRIDTIQDEIELFIESTKNLEREIDYSEANRIKQASQLLLKDFPIKVERTK